MRIIIYVGHHKVGSTALQVFLSQNWLALAQAGILYPSVETSGFSRNLAEALQTGAYKKGTTKHPPTDMNVREPHSALAYQMIASVTKRKVPPQFQRLPSVPQMLMALRKQVSSIQPHTMILCSEVFANFGQVDPNLITQLVAGFPKAEIEIYCALRRPDDYLISWHGQRLKVGETLAPLNDGGLAPYYDSIHFDFRTVIEPWNNKLPKARLILRPYNEILKSGGSENDFMAQTSVKFPTGLKPAGRANKSLPRAGMELARRANHDLPGNLSHAFCQYLLNGEDTLEPTPNSDVEMFGADVRAELANRFAPIHDYLSKLTNRPKFFEDIDDVVHVRPVPQTQAAADLLSQIDPRSFQNEDLRDYVKAQQRDQAPFERSSP